MITIRDVIATPYNIPMNAVLKWGQGHVLSQLEHVLITVVLSNGARGQAEATPRPSIYGETQASVLAIVQDHLKPRLQGQPLQSIPDIDALETSIHHIRGNHTAKGALNMALHAALAQSLGQSLFERFGVTAEKTRVSYIVSTGTPDIVLKDVEAAYHEGVRVFKVKIGAHVTQEVNTLQTLIEAFPQAQFYVDANQCLERNSALSLLDHLADMGVLYCEEPLPVHQVRERAALRQQTKLPIIADDSCFTAQDTLRELQLDTFDIVNIKTARTGFSQSQRIAQDARLKGKQLMVGSQASSLLGCLHAALFALACKSDCATECSFYLKTSTEYAGVPVLQDGYLSREAAEHGLLAFG